MLSSLLSVRLLGFRLERKFILSEAKEGTVTYELGSRKFVLDKKKAEQAFAEKKVVNGRQALFFDILPIKYQLAYDI